MVRKAPKGRRYDARRGAVSNHEGMSSSAVTEIRVAAHGSRRPPAGVLRRPAEIPSPCGGVEVHDRPSFTSTGVAVEIREQALQVRDLRHVVDRDIRGVGCRVR